MSFFLRKRSPDAKTNRAKKYILYAIGEILIIALGLFLAIQANNWNEARKGRAEEINILQNLRENLLRDTIELGVNMRSRYRMRLRDSAVLADLTTGVRPMNKEFAGNFSMVATNADYIELHTSVFEELKTKGISRITNDSLRDKIRHLYEFEYPRLAKVENELTEYDRYAFLFDSMSPYIGVDLDSTIANYPRRVILNYPALLDDKRLHFMINNYYRASGFVYNGLYVPVSKMVLELVGDVEAEIKRLQ